MTISIAAPARAFPTLRFSLRAIYLGALAAWLLTRMLVLVHQGAWPWMNAFVVAAARGIVVGDWNDAVRPQLPAMLGVPLVLAGLSEQQTVAVLYVLGSLVQFGSFLVLVRALFPERGLEQLLALLVFLLVPFNHSIHHYRDVPVLLASSAVFLMAAHLVKFAPRSGDWRSWLGVLGAALLGVWSRTEVVTFIGSLVLMALMVWRARALRLSALNITAAALGLTVFTVLTRAQGVDPAELARYQVHTFLDSTPESWLTPECRAQPTENCRERDGMTYFGPVVRESGVLPLVLNHPLTTLSKTARSAADNLWILLGPNISTFPGTVPFVALVLAVVPSARQALTNVGASAWIVALAAVGQTVLPPLSWAPPHPQYHLQLIVAVVIVVVPVLSALLRTSRGQLLTGAFFFGNLALSAFRYTRYPGY
jgi:hypothetical protein